MRIDFKYLEDQRYDSVTDYCRVLVEGEYPETLEVYRGDMLCLTVRVLAASKLAPSTVGFRKWYPRKNLEGHLKAARSPAGEFK